MRLPSHRTAHTDRTGSTLVAEPPVDKSSDPVDNGPSSTSSALATHRLRRFRTAQFVKKVATTGAAGLAVLTATSRSVPNQPTSNPDGVFDAQAKHDRWPIKTSIETTGPHTQVVTVPIEQLAVRQNLANPPDSKLYNGSRLTDTIQGLQEGQLVQTDAWIHLVAHETDDSDYHIQVNQNATNAEGDLKPCLIVEVPHPDAAGDAALSGEFANVRKFIRDSCFSGQDPSGTVSHPLHVRITGQLFFDLFHATHSTDPGGGRGKQVAGQPMKATTIWEIHPIINIQQIP